MNPFMTRTAWLWIILALTLAGCPSTPTPPLSRSIATCAEACAHLKTLGCPEGQPLEDGTTCQAFCEATADAGHTMDAGCVMTVTTCAELNVRCP